MSDRLPTSAEVSHALHRAPGNRAAIEESSEDLQDVDARAVRIVVTYDDALTPDVTYERDPDAPFAWIARYGDREPLDAKLDGRDILWQLAVGVMAGVNA